MWCDHVECRNVQSELSGLRKLANACAQAEQVVSGYARGEVGKRFAHVVYAVFLDAEDVTVWSLGVRGGARLCEEIVEGAASIVCKLLEECLRLGVC